MSPPERILWSRLRGEALSGLKFRRQHPFDPYVLDFYCHEARLAVEVDGMSHDGRADEDARRDRFLAANGVKTLRVSTSDIYSDLEGVVLAIGAAAIEPFPRERGKRREAEGERQWGRG